MLHQRKLPGPMPRHNISRLALFACVWLTLTLWFVVFPSQGHADWWTHVGLHADLKHNHHTVESSKQKPPLPTPKPTELVLIPQATLDKAASKRKKGRWTGRTIASKSDSSVILREGKDFYADYDFRKTKVWDLKHDRKHRFEYINETTANPPLVWLSDKPRLGVVPNFLTHEECDALIKEAEPKMRRSDVVNREGSAKKPMTIADVRTSSQTWLRFDDKRSATTKTVVNRILKYIGFGPKSAQPLQVLRYEKNQKYNSHHDYFDEKFVKSGGSKNNRAVTVFLYLSDVEEGGETVFPQADGKPTTWDFLKCHEGLGVRPKKGSMAIFYDMTPTGLMDPYSLHGGCPVIKGTKWAGTLWLMAEPVTPYKDRR